MFPRSVKEELRVTYSELANEFEKSVNAISLTLGSLDGDLEV